MNKSDQGQVSSLFALHYEVLTGQPISDLKPVSKYR